MDRGVNGRIIPLFDATSFTAILLGSLVLDLQLVLRDCISPKDFNYKLETHGGH
jgi:hypothetical protein